MSTGDKTSGGEGGIRTPGRGVSPYNGLANRRLQPLGHLSGGHWTDYIRSRGPGFQCGTRNIRLAVSAYFRRDLLVFEAIDRFDHLGTGVGRIVPAFHFYPLSFKVLVDGEEVSHFL